MSTKDHFAETIGAMPEFTIGELAKFVCDHPELGAMTLHELLACVPRPTNEQTELEVRLREALDPMPPTRITKEAVERIARTNLDVVGPIVAVFQAAKEHGVEITKLFIVSESLGPDDVAVAFEIGPHPQRHTLWWVVENMSPDLLPPTLWLRFL